MKPQRITHRLKRPLALLMALLLVFMQSAHAGNYIAFIHTDVLGSPVAVTDQNGNIVSREHVTPYGDSLGKRSADDTTAVGSSEHGIGYTGHVRDKDLGLTYMQARYYDPTIGRFMGTDPVPFSTTNPALFNRYAYANNNPYAFYDPNGESAASAVASIAAADGLTPDPSDAFAKYKALGYLGAYGLASVFDIAIGKMFTEEQDDVDEANQDDVKIDDKIASQLKPRGWTEEEIRDLVKNGKRTGSSVDKRSPEKTDDGLGRDDPASVYGTEEDGHVVVNDNTNEVVHVSDKNDEDWQTDGRIEWE